MSTDKDVEKEENSPRQKGVDYSEAISNCFLAGILPERINLLIGHHCSLALSQVDATNSRSFPFNYPHLEPVPIFSKKSGDQNEYRRYGLADPLRVIWATAKLMKDDALINFLFVDPNTPLPVSSFRNSWCWEEQIVSSDHPKPITWDKARWHFLELRSCSEIDIAANSPRTFSLRNHEERLLSRRFLFSAHLDVKTFYDSIYTHSFSWHSSDLDASLKDSLKSCDYFAMCANAGKTAGLVTGPLMSKVLSEILMKLIFRSFKKSVENEFEAESANGLHHLFHVVRFADDFRLYYSDEVVFRKLKKTLIKCLNDYHLLLNSAKTESEILVSVSNAKIRSASGREKVIIEERLSVWESDVDLRNKAEKMEISELKFALSESKPPDPYLVSMCISHIEEAYEILVNDVDGQFSKFADRWTGDDQLVLRFFKYCESLIINFLVLTDYAKVPRATSALDKACQIQLKVDPDKAKLLWEELLAVYINTSSEVVMINLFDLLFNLVHRNSGIGELEQLKRAAQRKLGSGISRVGIHSTQLMCALNLIHEKAIDDASNMRLENGGKRISSEWFFWLHLSGEVFTDFYRCLAIKSAGEPSGKIEQVDGKAIDTICDAIVRVRGFFAAKAPFRICYSLIRDN